MLGAKVTVTSVSKTNGTEQARAFVNRHMESSGSVLTRTAPELLLSKQKYRQAEGITLVRSKRAGYKNGEILKAAIEAGFKMLVTGDQTLQYERNLAGQKIAVVCLSANTWQILKLHVAKIEAIKTATPGSFTRVDVGTFSRSRRLPDP